MQLPYFLVRALSVAWIIRYPLLFVGAFAEGPILMIACGFMIHRGMLPFLPTFFALVLGDLTGDTLWYYLGFFFLAPLLNKKGSFMGIDHERLERIKQLFNKYHEKILIVSKLTLGFGLALGVLMVAGATKVPFKKYIFINFCGELVLVALLMTLGYFFGDVYSHVQAKYQVEFLIALIFAILAVIYGASRFLKKAALTL